MFKIGNIVQFNRKSDWRVKRDATYIIVNTTNGHSGMLYMCRPSLDSNVEIAAKESDIKIA